MANSVDFRADQVQTSKIIVTGSTPQKTLLIYGIDADDPLAPNQGNINPSVFDTSVIGSDVFLFVSGGINARGSSDPWITAFGGDLHISGNLTVDGTVPGGPSFFTEIAFEQIETTGSVAMTYLSASTGAEITGSLTQGSAGNVASGQYSHAEGNSTTASGQYSHAEGSNTIALGNVSHAAGTRTIASGSSQMVIGKYNTRNNDFSLFVVGNGTDDDDISRSDVFRVNNTAVQVTGSFEVLGGITGSLSGTVAGDPFIVAGSNITTNYNSLGQWEITGSGGGGTNFFTELDSTNIFTTSSVALAKLSASLGAEITGSVTQGSGGNIASGQYSHAEGGSTTASGDNSHAEGSGTTASGNYSHAEGSGTTASGQSSHAEGISTKAFGTGSLAVGLGTVASGAVDGGAIQTTVQAAFGKYNLENNTDSLFVVGDGLNSSNRHDVLRVNSGSVQVTGSLEVLGGITGSLSGTVAGNPFIVAGSNITASYNSLGQWDISTTSPPAGLDGSLKIPSDASWTVVGTGTATATSGELNLSCASAFPAGTIAMLTTAPTSPHFYAIELLARIQSNSLSTGGSGYALSLGFTNSAQDRGYRIRLDQAGNISDRVNTAGTWSFTGSSYSPGLSWSTGTTWLRMIVTNGYIQLYYGTGVGTTIPTSWSLAHLVATPDTTLIRNGTLDRLELLLEHYNATTGTLDIDVFPFTRSLITNPT